RKLQPMDPVTLGLCSQIDLDLEVSRAAKEKPLPPEQGVTLLPAEVTTAKPEPEPQAAQKPAGELDVQAVFAKLKQLGGKSDDKDDDKESEASGIPARAPERGRVHRTDQLPALWACAIGEC